MMNWCGIKFVAGPGGFLVPDRMAVPEEQFVGLRAMALEYDNDDAPDPDIFARIRDLRLQMANTIADTAMRAYSETINRYFPGFDPDMPDEPDDYDDDDYDDEPGHSELTDSTLPATGAVSIRIEDFLED